MLRHLRLKIWAAAVGVIVISLMASRTGASDEPAGVSTVALEREAESIVRDYVSLRGLVDPVSADETCKELITQVVLRIWARRDENRPQETIDRFISLHEALTYEYLVRAAANPQLKKRFQHFDSAIVSQVVPLPNGRRSADRNP